MAIIQWEYSAWTVVVSVLASWIVAFLLPATHPEGQESVAAPRDPLVGHGVDGVASLFGGQDALLGPKQ